MKQPLPADKNPGPLRNRGFCRCTGDKEERHGSINATAGFTGRGDIQFIPPIFAPWFRGVTAYPASGSRLRKLPSSTPACRVRPPVADGWVYEIKHDSFRLQIHARGNRVGLYTMTGVDWTDRYF
jgi:hypothetical protein